MNFSPKAHSHLGSWSWHPASDAVVWSPALHALFGLDPSQPPPNWLRNPQLFTPESFLLLEQALQQCLSTGAPFELTLEGISKTGRGIHLRFYGEAERDEGGSVVSLFGQCIDCTAEVLAVRALEQARAESDRANELKSHFLANMSHEIRTPLNAIIGMAELLEYDSKRTDIKDCLRTIHSCGDALLDLINDILDYSKIEAGEVELENAPMDIRDCADASLKIISTMAAEKGLELTASVDPRITHLVMGDAFRLRQILLNLLMNAVKVTDRGAVKLDIILGNETFPSRRVLFSVGNTGATPGADQQNRLHNAFIRADESLSSRNEGTGLGMAISRKLVGLMGGTLSVDWKPGGGSLFSFSLPFKPTESDPAVTLESGDLQPLNNFFLGMNNPMKILVAEDNKVNQQVIQLMLSRLGYDDVTIVATGLEVLEAVNKNRFDLVLMDIQMPVMNGLEATKAILHQHAGGSLPQIVALTANATKEDRAAALAAGMKDYLVKPLHRKQLAATLQQVYSRMPPKPLRKTPANLDTE